ncbi:hypothetical protein PB1E_1516 [Leuconostoc gelidum subsp. gasicomitatum]|nr:hypothetical protein PB1E_1516 [Leuconostoc gasicomitatum]
MSMKLHRYIHSVQSQTFEYRDLTNLLNGHDVNSESGINLIEAKLKQAKKQYPVNTCPSSASKAHTTCSAYTKGDTSCGL